MITTHRNMLEDKVRCNSYKKAIMQIIKPGHTVVDIGTGSGLLSYFALMAGAKKVYAIDWGDIIEDSKKIAKCNNFLDRIEFIKNVSTNVVLPTKVDVIISEILGSFAIEEDIVKFLNDAKKRFLKRKGIIIPFCVEMKLALIEAKQEYENLIGFWNKNLYGIDYSEVLEEALNYRYTSSNLSINDLISNSEKIHTIDFYKLDKEDISINKSVNFKIKRKGTIYGMAGWFKTYLTENVILSTFSKNKKTHWGVNFFPIKNPIKVEKGENILVKISGQKVFNTTVWTWEIKNKNHIFKHSTFKNMKFNKEKILQNSLDYIPLLDNEEKKVLEFIFNKCDGTKSIKQISEELYLKYPENFPTFDKAQNKVRNVILSNNIKEI